MKYNALLIGSTQYKPSDTKGKNVQNMIINTLKLLMLCFLKYFEKNTPSLMMSSVIYSNIHHL